jgi:hypothetical protein
LAVCEVQGWDRVLAVQTKLEEKKCLTFAASFSKWEIAVLLLGVGCAHSLPSPLCGGLLSQREIFQILSPPIAFHRCLVPIAGSVNGALMLSQAIYWTARTKDTQGWFYKSQKDWEDETALSRSEQEIARKLLRGTGFWQEKLRGVPATLYFRVDCEILQSSLQNLSIQVCRKSQTSLQNPANKIADSCKLSQRLPETTQETTSKGSRKFGGITYSAWDVEERNKLYGEHPELRPEGW